jgi:flagellar motility protein MotE (MotC chaperone)
MHGVDAMTISFGQIRRIEIPELSVDQQFDVRRQYLAMAKQHDRAMAIKERLLDESGIKAGQYGEAINELANKNTTYKQAMAEAQERLKHLIAELEAVLDGEQKKIKPFPG